jgi:prepilin-type N-terminal cleavage/methylation domain-containing protein
MMRRRGFSLVEVIVAMVILAIAIPPLVFQMAAGVQQQATVLIQQNLTQLAADRLWQVYEDHADPTRGYSYVVDAAYPDEEEPLELTGYSRQTTILEVSATDYTTAEPDSGIKRFRVVVRGPRDLSLVLEGLIADVGGARGSS